MDIHVHHSNFTADGNLTSSGRYKYWCEFLRNFQQLDTQPAVPANTDSDYVQPNASHYSTPRHYSYEHNDEYRQHKHNHSHHGSSYHRHHHRHKLSQSQSTIMLFLCGWTFIHLNDVLVSIYIFNLYLI